MYPGGAKDSHLDSDVESSWRQEEVKRAKLGPRWGQVADKRRQRERIGGLRNDLETKRFAFESNLSSLGKDIFLGCRAAKWRQVGVRNWKDKVKIAKVEAKLEDRRQDRSKRSEEEARITKRRRKLRSEIAFTEVHARTWRRGGGGDWAL